MKRKYFVGDTFNNWTLKDRKVENNKAVWTVKCSCGKEFERSTINNIVSGNSKKCRSCADKEKESNYDIDKVSNRFYYKIKLSAEKRGYSFDISQEYLTELYINQDKKCAISGLDISLAKNKKEMDSFSFTVSLDRIDSDKPYTKSNIQWVHKDVNVMKNTFSQKYFLEMCKIITENNYE
jgi:hypothetical protein